MADTPSVHYIFIGVILKKRSLLTDLQYVKLFIHLFPCFIYLPSQSDSGWLNNAAIREKTGIIKLCWATNSATLAKLAVGVCMTVRPKP